MTLILTLSLTLATSSATNTKLHHKQNQTDQITVESAAGELNSWYGVYKADLIIHSIPDKTVIPSDGPITMCAARSGSLVRTNNIGSHLEQTQNERERGVGSPFLLATICDMRSSRRTFKWRCIGFPRSLS